MTINQEEVAGKNYVKVNPPQTKEPGEPDFIVFLFVLPIVRLASDGLTEESASN